MKDLLNGLNKAATEIHEGNVSRGFWDVEHDTGTYLMLMTSELAEALEADREGKNRYLTMATRTDFSDKGDPMTKFEQSAFRALVKDTVQDELADCMIRILDYCAAKEIDIEWHIRQKVRYNDTRARLHGKKY